MSTLGQMFAASTATLTADLARLRAGQSHAASKGSSAEEALRELLRQHLPASIGITSGQVADSSGAMSKQVDAILYDAAHTPMIFQSPDGGVRTVPAEGVLACMEIKTHLRSDMLSGILENCHSVKSLERSAFIPQHIEPQYRAYDRSWTDLPIHYSVFAFESDGTYSAKLNELQRERALHERVDLVCYLERGVSLNGFLAKDDDPTSLTWSPTSTSFGGLMDADTDNALLV